MRFISSGFTFILICCVINSIAQTGKVLSVNIIPTFGDSAFHFNEPYYKLKTGDSIEFETLRFYLSEIELWNDDKKIFEEKNSFHLVDASVSSSLNILLGTNADTRFNKIKFNIGIDSITNVSGAMGGDLDPTKGMYWTWQSGYINLKLEGKSNLCKTRNNEFQFHIGGYQHPFNACQTITLGVANGNSILLDLKKLIDNIDLSNQNQIMSPGKNAVLLSEIISKSFSASAP